MPLQSQLTKLRELISEVLVVDIISEVLHIEVHASKLGLALLLLLVKLGLLLSLHRRKKTSQSRKLN